MAKLRVALVTRFPYIEADAFSGLSQVSLRLAEALAARDDIDLGIISLTSRVRRLERRDAGAYSITFLPKHSSAWYYGTLSLPASFAVQRELARFQPDIVHAQAIGETVLGSLFARYPLVATLHGLYASEIASAPSRRIQGAIRVLALAEAYYVPRLRHIISCSPYVTRFVRARNPQAQLYDISNPMDARFFEVDLARAHPTPNSILLIGSITYRKAHDVMVEALKRLVADGIEARLTIIGPEADPVFASAIKETIRTEGLTERVRWLGPVSQAQLIEEMQGHQIVCLPSREETLPMSLSQAMIVGNIPVASDAGGIPDMLQHGENGFMAPANDASALARVLAQVLRLPDRVQDALRQRNRAFADQTYHPTSVAANTVDVYRRILGQAP